MVSSGEKRGQFTVFVILGFLLLVIVLFTLFIVSLMQDANYDQQARRAVEDFLDASSINYYIYTCMDSSVNEAVIELMQSGGVYYSEFGGNYEKTNPGENYITIYHDFGFGLEEVNVSYSIENKYGCSRIFLEPSEYPIPAITLDNLQSTYLSSQYCGFHRRPFKESGVFGYNNLSRLCHPDGLNFNEPPNLISHCADNLGLVLETTIEDELAKMIVNKMNNCTNFTIFEEQEDHNITLIDEPSAKLVYNEESFSVVFEFPFEIKLKNRQPVIVKREFEYSSDLRLVRLHNFVLNLLVKEVQNPFFNLQLDYPSVRGYDPNHMTLKIIDYESGEFKDCNECDWKDDFILFIEDNYSDVGGKNLTFMTAFKNRNPALDFIHQTSEGSTFDIIKMEGESIELEPFGIDPEETQITYDYLNWKETYDEYYDFDSNDCNGVNGPNSYAEYLACIKLEPHPTNPQQQLQNWTKSDPYVANQKDASYDLVQKKDTGVHNTTVRITDEDGLQDWQRILILILDLPELKITTQTPYNLREGIFSIEDPFKLDSTDSKPSTGARIDQVEWKILEKVGTSFNSIFTSGLLPFDPNNNAQNVLNFPDAYLSSNIQTIHTYSPFDAIGSYEIHLIAHQLSDFLPIELIPSQPEIINVEVAECIPYRGNTDAYPYNGGGGGDFLTNHSCCLGDITNDPPSDWSVATQTQNIVCFDDAWYGEKKQLEEKAKDLMYNNKLSDYYAEEFISPLSPNRRSNAGNSNDIIRMEFERTCDGNRGNICAGAGDYNFYVEVACSSQYQPSSDQSEMCAGPSPGVSSSAPTQCALYSPGNTFETTFNLPGATGICEQTFECSTVTSGGEYADGGPKDCQATCDGNGNCKYPTNCACDVSKCSAECDANPNNQVRRDGLTCNYGCDLENTCTFTNRADLPCSGNSCFRDVGNGFYGEIGCFSNVKCTADPQTDPLYNYEICASAGNVLTVREGNNNVDYCFYGSYGLACSASGTCNVRKKSKSDSTGCVCNANSGWVCS